jgi:hypothetical protein
VMTAAGLSGGRTTLNWIIQLRCDSGEMRWCHCIVTPKTVSPVRGKSCKCEMEEKCAAGSCTCTELELGSGAVWKLSIYPKTLVNYRFTRDCHNIVEKSATNLYAHDALEHSQCRLYHRV